MARTASCRSTGPRSAPGQIHHRADRGADTRPKQAEKLRAACLVEAFVGLGEQPPAAIQRIVFAAPMTRRVVVDPAPDLVESRRWLASLITMKRIGDLGGAGQHRIER